MAVEIFYFDGHISSTFGSGWFNTTNVFDGNEATLTENTSTRSSISFEGVNCPTTGGEISQVRVRAYTYQDGEHSVVSYVKSGGEAVSPSLGADYTGLWASDSTPVWDTWRVMDEPSGGWSWTKVNELRFEGFSYEGAPFGNDFQWGVGKVEVEVTYTQPPQPPTQKFLLSTTQATGTHTNFPAAVDLSILGITTQAEADSVRVYTDESKSVELPREIVSPSIMWVKLDALSNSDTYYVEYDGVSADYAVTDTYGRNAVWSDYELVMHCHNDIDSTGNYTPTVSGGASFGNTPGIIGDALYLDGSNDSWSVSGSTNLTELENKDVTITAFVKNYFNTYSPPREAPVFGNYPGTGPSPNQFFSLSVDSDGNTKVASRRDNDAEVITTAFGPSVKTNSWQKVTLRKNGTTFSLLQNGVQPVSSVSFSTEGKTDNQFEFGGGVSIVNRYNQGSFTELRYRNSAVSNDWEATEYANQSNPDTFWTVTPVISNNGFWHFF
ncbi:LamG-like jellyroll fold domain-containing protein [Paracoccaceae bacterium GXU_MW_L88]